LNPATFYWSVCTNPWKWAIMYLYVWGIDFASFYDLFYWILELFWHGGIFLNIWQTALLLKLYSFVEDSCNMIILPRSTHCTNFHIEKIKTMYISGWIHAKFSKLCAAIVTEFAIGMSSHDSCTNEYHKYVFVACEVFYFIIW